MFVVFKKTTLITYKDYTYKKETKRELQVAKEKIATYKQEPKDAIKLSLGPVTIQWNYSIETGTKEGQ